LIELILCCDIVIARSAKEKQMKADTVLYEIYSELGLLETLQSEDVQEFVSSELESFYANSSTAAA
jgi:hypothetical protein